MSTTFHHFFSLFISTLIYFWLCLTFLLITRTSQIFMEKIKWVNLRISNPFKEPSSLSKMNLLSWPMGMKGNPFLAPSSNQLAIILWSLMKIPGNPLTFSTSQWGLEEINVFQSNVDGIPSCNEIIWFLFLIFLLDPFNHDHLLTFFHPFPICSSKYNYLQK